MKAGKYALVNYGGSFQLDIKNASDLEALQIMDEAFWMCTSAPTFGLNCDDDLIALLDKNKNGRILSSDVRDACEQILRILKNHQGLEQKSGTITESDFNDDDKEAKILKSAVTEIKKNLNKKTGDSLNLQDLRDDKAILCNGLTNGDGIIPAEDVEDDALKQFIKDIMLCMGSHDDVNGKPGIGQEKLNAFLERTQKYLNWKDSKHFSAEILPLQEKTADAYNAFAAIRPKVNEYFQLCELKKFNDDISRKQKEPDSPINVYNSSADIADYLKTTPLAPITDTPILNLEKAINPHFSSMLNSLRVNVLEEILTAPVTQLDQTDWQKVCDVFKPYEQWQQKEEGVEVKAIDESTLRSYVSGELPSQLQYLIETDLKLGEKLKERDDLENIIILQKGLLDFCNNYVSFPHLYNPEQRAIFEIGHLVIDGRIFNFNIPVKDIKAHAAIAERSGIYLLYLEITGSKEDKPFYICTPVTSLHLGLLGVGKRGVLFDLDGKEWDATVVKVLQNPVSLTEAILAPFKKITSLLSGAVDKISSGTEQELEKKLNKVTTGIQQDVSGTSKPVKKVSSTTARDVMLTGSVTFAALGSSFAYISSTFANLDPKKAMAAFAIGMLVILFPIIIISSIKLYRRNLSSILEASEWAINARMRLTYKWPKF